MLGLLFHPSSGVGHWGGNGCHGEGEGPPQLWGLLLQTNKVLLAGHGSHTLGEDREADAKQIDVTLQIVSSQLVTVPQVFIVNAIIYH